MNQRSQLIVSIFFLSFNLITVSGYCQSKIVKQAYSHFLKEEYKKALLAYETELNTNTTDRNLYWYATVSANRSGNNDKAFLYLKKGIYLGLGIDSEGFDKLKGDNRWSLTSR